MFGGFFDDASRYAILFIVFVLLYTFTHLRRTVIYATLALLGYNGLPSMVTFRTIQSELDAFKITVLVELPEKTPKILFLLLIFVIFMGMLPQRTLDVMPAMMMMYTGFLLALPVVRFVTSGVLNFVIGIASAAVLVLCAVLYVIFYGPEER